MSEMARVRVWGKRESWISDARFPWLSEANAPLPDEKWLNSQAWIWSNLSQGTRVLFRVDSRLRVSKQTLNHLQNMDPKP